MQLKPFHHDKKCSSLRINSPSLLYLGENTAKAYDNVFWALDTEGNRKTPIVYEQEEGKVLVYSKKDVMYNNALHLQGEYNEGYDNIDIELD